MCPFVRYVVRRTPYEVRVRTPRTLHYTLNGVRCTVYGVRCTARTPYGPYRYVRCTRVPPLYTGSGITRITALSNKEVSYEVIVVDLIAVPVMLILWPTIYYICISYKYNIYALYIFIIIYHVLILWIKMRWYIFIFLFIFYNKR